MRGKVLLAVFLAAVLAGWACKSSTGPEEAELTGSWLATKAEYVSVANSSVKVDIIAGGSTLSLALDPNGVYTLTITDPGEQPVAVNGTWTFSVDTMTLTPDGGSGNMQFDMNLDGDTLTLFGGGAQYEFTAGSPEDATLNITLARQ